MKQTLSQNTPRLTTENPSNRKAGVCQRCGRRSQDPEWLDLNRWQEHDHRDQPEHKLLFLCKPCSIIIEPHPRLYTKLDDNEPWPGAMPICIGCLYHSGVECTHRLAKANGGPGVHLVYDAPVTGFACSRGKGCTILRNYVHPVKSCSHRVDEDSDQESED